MRKRNRCEGSFCSCFAICLRRYSLTAASIDLALYAQACLATLGSPVGALSTRPCLVRHRYSRFLSGHSNSNWSHRNPLPPHVLALRSVVRGHWPNMVVDIISLNSLDATYAPLILFPLRHFV